MEYIFVPNSRRPWAKRVQRKLERYNRLPSRKRRTIARMRGVWILATIFAENSLIAANNLWHVSNFIPLLAIVAGPILVLFQMTPSTQAAVLVVLRQAMYVPKFLAQLWDDEAASHSWAQGAEFERARYDRIREQFGTDKIVIDALEDDCECRGPCTHAKRLSPETRRMLLERLRASVAVHAQELHAELAERQAGASGGYDEAIRRTID